MVYQYDFPFAKIKLHPFKLSIDGNSRIEKKVDVNFGFRDFSTVIVHPNLIFILSKTQVPLFNRVDIFNFVFVQDDNVVQ